MFKNAIRIRVNLKVGFKFTTTKLIIFKKIRTSINESSLSV